MENISENRDRQAANPYANLINPALLTVRMTVHVYADPDGFQADFDSQRGLWKAAQLAYQRVAQTNLEVSLTGSDSPDFTERHFDVLMFDYGGMWEQEDSRLLLYGGDPEALAKRPLIKDLTKKILRDAEEHPSRYYVMISRFTRRAIEDFLATNGGDVPANMHLDQFKFFDAIERGEVVFG